MSYKIGNRETKTLIEFSNQNGHVRLIKEENYHIDKYGLRILNKPAYSPFIIEYSSDGVEWSACAKYDKIAKNIQHDHFHAAVKSLNEGTKIRPIQRY
jgi:hypothetical protein